VTGQRQTISKFAGLELFSDFPVAVFALNSSRQIVYMNERGRTLLSALHADPYGLRPGEAFSCIHADEAPGGCGTTHFCQFCGAAKTLSAAIEGVAQSEECRFERRVGERIEQLDLSVWSKPLPVGTEQFLLFAAIDISADKRREVFERIFLHDLLNTATSISSLLRLLDPENAAFDDYLELAQGAAEQLGEEILAHRALRDAEQGTLTVEGEVFSLTETLSTVTKTYRRIAEARGIEFEVNEVPRVAVQGGQVLLKRVLSNLLKNAIEASTRGERVTLACSVSADTVELRIGNPAVMSEEVIANLFKRSFSTKGKGRGLGTYAARLFVEEYLGGTIRCESAEGKGTVFTVRVPL
jgi:signal transduction histidine kinase